MKRAVKPVVWVLLLMVLGYFGVRIHSTVRGRRSLEAGDQSSGEALRVAVESVATATLANTVYVTGEVKALARVDVVPKIRGRLERLRLADGTLIEEGVSVDEGQIVAVIEHAALEAAVESAESALDVAEAAQKRATVNLEEAEREKTRWEGLYKEGPATEQQRDQVVTAYERSVAELRLAESQVDQADALLRQATVILDEATIEAPISGVVTRKYVDEGDMVGASTPLVTIAQMDTVKVVGGVSERYLSLLVPGETAVWLSVDAYPDEEFQGVVHRAGPEVDAQTRTLEVEARLSNPDHRLKPGMFARMSLILDKRDNATVVPDAALLREGSQVYAYVVSDSKAHRRVLQLGLSEGPRHEVIDGLEPGELVVIRGQHMLHDGDEVTTVEEVRK